MIKILNFIQCLNLGGMEQSAYSLIESTQGQTVDWTVQSVTPVGEGLDKLTKFQVPVKGSPYIGRFGWRSHALLKKDVDSFDGDIILITGPTLTSCAAVKRHRAKKVLGVHFVHGQRQQDIAKWKTFYKLFGSDYDAFIYHSQHIFDEAVSIAPSLAHKFRLINYATTRCSIPNAQEKEASRKLLGIPKGHRVIGNAGWLIQRKRFDVFLKTCQRIKERYSKVKFLIAGDGNLRSELESLALSLGIFEDVIFLGWQQSLDNFYKSLDILLFNSDSDAFGRTVMEAMGYGVPSVASVVEGGPKSILIDGENGFMTTAHDVEMLSQNCLLLLEDENRYWQFQSKAIATIKNQCSHEKYIENYLSVFREVLTK